MSLEAGGSLVGRLRTLIRKANGYGVQRRIPSH
jgi:hypothetical protein